MGIFSQVKSSTNSILPKFFDDPDLVVSVTWKVFGGSTFDEAQGINVETFTDYSLDAIRIEKEIGTFRANQAVAPPGPWMMATGETVYLFKYEDVPSGASIRDFVVDGSYTYGIRKILPVFNMIVKVEVKGYA